jgi:YD repeat-containing protein
VLLLVLPTLPRLVDMLQLRLPLRTSLVVREAVSRAAEDPRIIAQLGQPIETHWNIAGYQRTNESGWSEGRVWIPISGPRGDATLYARAGRGSGLWVFTTLEFRPAGGESIDLLARRDASMTDLSPRGRVYLIHAGFPATIDLNPFRDYYRQTLGLDVTVLPSIDIADDAFDRARGQLVAESVVASMRRSLPVSPEDPEAIVLGVVEQDMYIAELNWNYAFSFRADDRFALVSTARMVPSFQALWPRHDLVRSRLRKMLNKNIGILVYRLPLNDDPTSVMYGNVDSVGDLDNMQERFEGLGRQAVVSPTVVTHHSSALEPEIGTTTPPDPVDATYPCFLVSPVFDTNGSTPVTSVGDRCTPGMHTDRRFDEVEINLRSRLLVTRHTDFLRPDSMPLVLTRAHHAWDRQSRAFGIGGNHPYDILPIGSRSPYTYVDIIMADGATIHYDRISKGTDYADAVYEHHAQTTFLDSRFKWNGNGWDLRLADGGLFVFPENYAGVRPNQGAPLGMQDAAGHRITFERDQDRNLKRLTSPSGHFLTFAYDDGYRIRRVTDDDGHAVQYDYDAGGRLAVVNDGARRLRYLYDGTLLTNVTTDAGQSLLVVKYQDGQVVELSVGSRRFRFSPAFDQRDDKMPSRMEITDERGDVRSVDVAQPH